MQFLLAFLLVLLTREYGRETIPWAELSRTNRHPFGQYEKPRREVNKRGRLSDTDQSPVLLIFVGIWHKFRCAWENAHTGTTVNHFCYACNTFSSGMALPLALATSLAAFSCSSRRGCNSKVAVISFHTTDRQNKIFQSTTGGGHHVWVKPKIYFVIYFVDIFEDVPLLIRKENFGFGFRS